MKNSDTSWQAVHKWYDQSVGELGHYYHQHIILPNTLRLLGFQKEPSRILDLACGQGVLARHLPAFVDYLGIDGSASLIKAAKKHEPAPHHQFVKADICNPLPLKEKDLFTHATIILALQNVSEPEKVLHHLSRHLLPSAKCVIVLNHPCFRIPRQSSWGIDEEQKIQYRKIQKYLSPLKIPIQMKPSHAEQSEVTWSFHHPLSSYAGWLCASGFSIDTIEEWTSDKMSTGKFAAMENRARKEFPLFLAFLATKK